jgi:hypothetical protein
MISFKAGTLYLTDWDRIMSKAEQLLIQVEIQLNKFGAELTAQMVILQTLVAHLTEAFPNFSEEILHDLKKEAMGVLKQQTIDTQADVQEQQHTRELSIEHAEQFFRELEVALSKTRNKVGQSGRN